MKEGFKLTQKLENVLLIIMIIVFLYCYIYLQVTYPKIKLIEEYDRSIPIIDDKNAILDYQIFGNPTSSFTIYYSHAKKEGAKPKIKTIYLNIFQSVENITFENRATIMQKGWSYDFLKSIYSKEIDSRDKQRLELSNKISTILSSTTKRKCSYDFNNSILFNKSNNLRCYWIYDNSIYNLLSKDYINYLYNNFSKSGLVKIGDYIPDIFGNNFLIDKNNYLLTNYGLYFGIYDIRDYKDITYNDKTSQIYSVFRMPLQKNWTLYLLFLDLRENRLFEDVFVWFDLNISNGLEVSNLVLKENITNYLKSNKLQGLMENREYDYVKLGNKNCYPLLQTRFDYAKGMIKRIENVYCITEDNGVINSLLFTMSCEKSGSCSSLSDKELEDKLYSFIEGY